MAPEITSRKRNAYSQTTIREQMIEALGSDQIEYTLADGTMVHFAHPLFRSKDLKAQIKAFTQLEVEDQDDDEFCRLILGEDFDAFVEHGGGIDDLNLAFFAIQRDLNGAINGKRPTRS